jgi:hypothetical protein
MTMSDLNMEEIRQSYDLHVDVKSNNIKGRITQGFHWIKIGLKHLKTGRTVLVVSDFKNTIQRPKP